MATRAIHADETADFLRDAAWRGMHDDCILRGDASTYTLFSFDSAAPLRVEEDGTPREFRGAIYYEHPDGSWDIDAFDDAKEARARFAAIIKDGLALTRARSSR